MSISLEKRIRKIEKAMKPAKQRTWDPYEMLAFVCTPEGLAIAEAQGAELVRGMLASKRARIEAMSSPEQVERFRKKWAEEDEAAKRHGYW